VRAALLLPLVLLAAGCDRDVWVATTSVPGPSFDLDAAEPGRILQLTTHLSQEGRPGGKRYAGSDLWLNLGVRHYQGCRAQDCAFELLVHTPQREEATVIVVPSGERADVPVRVSEPVQDCPRRDACSRTFEIELELIGDELLEIDTSATFEVYGTGRRVLLQNRDLDVQIADRGA